jgi:hypothetical protein
MRTIVRTPIEYPSSDGQPMAENTRPFESIATIKGGLDAVFRDRPDVFVAGDNLCYPVEAHPEVRQAPDVYVAFGPPKGHRPSYKQWEEGGTPLHVVFEILSPSNRGPELIRKFQFYECYGFEEYYVYDPDDGRLAGWQRGGSELVEISSMPGRVSPRLGVRFELDGLDLKLFAPDGSPFLTYLELFERRLEFERRAEEDRLARLQAQQRADAERRRADAERNRAEQLAARLRALGVNPDEL